MREKKRVRQKAAERVKERERTIPLCEMLKLYIVVKNMKPLFGGKLVKFNAANVVKFLENDK